MGFDLKPRNKELEWLTIGAFSWPWMLDAGLGLVLGTGKAIKPAEYSYIPDKKGASPQSNDGYYVTSKQAKIMSVVAKGLVQVERFKSKQWNDLTAETQQDMREMNDKYKIYNLPVREDFIDKVEKFAEWSKKSGGFWIW